MIASGVNTQSLGWAEVGEIKKAQERAPAAAASASEPSAEPAPLAGEPAATTSPPASPPHAPLSLGPDFEITAGTNGLFSFSDASSQLSVFADVRYRLSDIVQFGGSIAYRFQSENEVSSSSVQALFGPTINFLIDGTIQNSFFLSARIGVTKGQTMFGNIELDSSTEPTAALNAGKRFAIGKHVAYAPSVGVALEASVGPVFTVQPLAFSIFF